MTDPKTWESSWTASLPIVRIDRMMHEYVCHEGDYGLFNIPAEARMEELAEVAKYLRWH